MKWIHKLLRAMSLATALFVFQACYGTPQIPDDQQFQDEQTTKAADPGENAAEDGQETAAVETPAE
jgi:hypothetical protein